jgi:hypothetical protein
MRFQRMFHRQDADATALMTKWNTDELIAADPPLLKATAWFCAMRN